MHNLMLANVLAALIAAIGVTGADALGAELEGALQYPPSSIGKDAQPPAPAGMVRQPRRSSRPDTREALPPANARWVHP